MCVEKTILIIDDEFELCNCLKSYLAGRGLRADCITNPEEAETYLGANRPALILLDYCMQPISGRVLLSRFRAMKLDVPVVVMSAYLTRDSIFEYKDLGVMECLQKPFPFSRLDAILAALGLAPPGETCAPPE